MYIFILSVILALLPSGKGGAGAPDPCSPNPCQNEGVCASSGGTYSCTCSSSFTGTNCDTAVTDGDGLSAGEIAGIVVGCVAFVVIVIVIIFICKWKCSKCFHEKIVKMGLIRDSTASEPTYKPELSRISSMQSTQRQKDLANKCQLMMQTSNIQN